MATTLSSVYKNAHTYLYTHEYTCTCVYTQQYTFLWLYAYRHIHISPALAAPSAAQTQVILSVLRWKHNMKSWGVFGGGLEKVPQWPKNRVPHFHVFLFENIDASRICMSSWCKNQDNLRTVLILVLGLSTPALGFKQMSLEGKVDATLVVLLNFQQVSF